MLVELFLSKWSIFVMYNLFTFEKRVVIDVILPAVLVSPEQLLVGRHIWFIVSVRIVAQKRSRDLFWQLLNAMAVMSDLVMWDWALLNKSRFKVDMIMFVRRLVKMS